MSGSDAAARTDLDDRRQAAEPAVYVKRVDLVRGRREAEMLARINHPNVVRLVGWTAEADHARLQLAYIEGRDLEAVLAEGRLDPSALADLLCGIAEATHAVHTAGFIHRDLKPTNIRVRADGTPVLIDFGAAAPIDDAVPEAISWLTDGYAAPEQYQNEPEGPWTDVYALGAIGFRALTGYPPPDARKRLLAAAALALPTHAHLGLSRVLEAALALDPAARPASATAFKDLVRRAISTASDCPPTVPVERTTRKRIAARALHEETAAAPPARRRGWLVALLALAAVTAAAAAGVWQGRPYYERWVKQDWLVDPAGGGDALTIGDALERSGAGATIRIAAGTYAESLVAERPVHLVAADGEAPPLIAPENGVCIALTVPGASLRNLRLVAQDGSPCVDIQADALIEGSTVASPTGTAIRVGSGAAPTVRGNVVEDSRVGIVVRDGATASISGNRIRTAEGTGLVVRSGAAPTVSENRLEETGAVFLEGAGGVLVGNEVLSAPSSGVVIASGAHPTLRENRIETSGGAGVHVYDHGRGELHGNRLVASALSGVVIEAGGDLILDGNAIETSGEHGILILDGARAVVRSNSITSNERHGIAIAPGAEVELDSNELRENEAPDVLDARPEAEESS